MPNLEQSRNRWVPETDEERQCVLDALERVAASPGFSNSKRYPALLRYVVEQTLQGTGDQIKERTVGMEVFGRQPDYDTGTDTVVRYTAGEVRKRLALYYHDRRDEPIQIALSARSYLPEFIKNRSEQTPETSSERNLKPVPLNPSALPTTSVLRPKRAFPLLWLNLSVLALALLFGGGFWVQQSYQSRAVARFWSPIERTPGPVVISAGAVAAAHLVDPNARFVEPEGHNNYLSFQNGLAMGRVSALLSANDTPYKIQAAGETTLEQIRQTPAVLIGAFNNIWALRELQPLRFHYIREGTNEVIVDTYHPEVRWMRDPHQPYADSPDYAIVARFRDPSSGSWIVAVGGIQRFGTETASQFVISPQLLQEFDRRVGWNWTEKNVEVVLKVDVVHGKVGAPSIEASHIW